MWVFNLHQRCRASRNAFLKELLLTKPVEEKLWTNTRMEENSVTQSVATVLSSVRFIESVIANSEDQIWRI